jgi:hypothetical protein
MQYKLQVEFFEGGDWAIGDSLELQLARCFSFDASLLGRLIAVTQSQARAAA